MLTTSSH